MIETIGGVGYYKARRDEVTLKDGFTFTLCTWGEGVRTRLPKSDLVSYVSLDLEAGSKALFVPWRAFHDIVPCDVGLGEPSGDVYLLTPERPSDEQMAQLQAAAIDLVSGQDGVRKLKKAVRKAKTSMVYAALDTSTGRRGVRIA